MNNQELLEMAAKAAGITGVWHEQWQCLSLFGRPHVISAAGQLKHTWDPLNDDGDALRLAAALSIDITFDADGVVMAGNAPNMVGLWDAMEPNVPDKMAATRRAIVSAAVALGARA